MEEVFHCRAIPLFLRLQGILEGVENTVNEKILNRSISWMFAALLLILSFIRGPIQTWMLAAAFAAWAVYLAARLLLPRVKAWLVKRKGADKRPKKRRAVKKQRDIPMPEETPTVLVEGSELERLLLGHISCRISEKLKSAYPQATWQWCSPKPESIIRGGTGRIRTFNTEDYTHAEVTVGEYFKIAFKMMKIVDFSAAVNPCPDDAADAEPTDEAEPKVVDPAGWYDLVGREVLTGLIRDWSTRGHSMLHIAEDGKVFFTEGADEIQAEDLKEFPTKQYWPELVKCLEKDDLKTQLQENRMDVLWN